MSSQVRTVILSIVMLGSCFFSKAMEAPSIEQNCQKELKDKLKALCILSNSNEYSESVLNPLITKAFTCITEGANPNTQDETTDLTLLHLAVKYNNIQIVQALLEKNANFLETTKKAPMTPLLLAALQRSINQESTIFDVFLNHITRNIVGSSESMPKDIVDKINVYKKVTQPILDTILDLLNNNNQNYQAIAHVVRGLILMGAQPTQHYRSHIQFLFGKKNAKTLMNPTLNRYATIEELLLYTWPNNPTYSEWLKRHEEPASPPVTVKNQIQGVEKRLSPLLKKHFNHGTEHRPLIFKNLLTKFNTAQQQQQQLKNARVLSFVNKVHQRIEETVQKTPMIEIRYFADLQKELCPIETSNIHEATKNIKREILITAQSIAYLTYNQLKPLITDKNLSIEQEQKIPHLIKDINACFEELDKQVHEWGVLLIDAFENTLQHQAEILNKEIDEAVNDFKEIDQLSMERSLLWQPFLNNDQQTNQAVAEEDDQHTQQTPPATPPTTEIIARESNNTLLLDTQAIKQLLGTLTDHLVEPDEQIDALTKLWLLQQHGTADQKMTIADFFAELTQEARLCVFNVIQDLVSNKHLMENNRKNTTVTSKKLTQAPSEQAWQTAAIIPSVAAQYNTFLQGLSYIYSLFKHQHSAHQRQQSIVDIFAGLSQEARNYVLYVFARLTDYAHALRNRTLPLLLLENTLSRAQQQPVNTTLVLPLLLESVKGVPATPVIVPMVPDQENIIKKEEEKKQAAQMVEPKTPSMQSPVQPSESAENIVDKQPDVAAQQYEHSSSGGSKAAVGIGASVLTAGAYAAHMLGRPIPAISPTELKTAILNHLENQHYEQAYQLAKKNPRARKGLSYIDRLHIEDTIHRAENIIAQQCIERYASYNPLKKAFAAPASTSLIPLADLWRIIDPNPAYAQEYYDDIYQALASQNFERCYTLLDEYDLTTWGTTQQQALLHLWQKQWQEAQQKGPQGGQNLLKLEVLQQHINWPQ